ncbi:hypothetical protein C4D60_Mb06t03550 [Musa balbisiana]|uniref:Uncharacterized protein n=1 Tax=Musa balbisiana TaxID=52838 RepID=A0A4S8IL23_MUSBA|nr:hypothetical protein C4D60_Mb06t03550 [Musa balbisiana]
MTEDQSPAFTQKKVEEPAEKTRSDEQKQHRKGMKEERREVTNRSFSKELEIRSSPSATNPTTRWRGRRGGEDLGA